MRKMLVATVMSTIASSGRQCRRLPNRQGVGSPEAFVCEGEDTLIVTAGRNGWIDDPNTATVTFSIEGTSRQLVEHPSRSASPTWRRGKDANSPDLITCTSDFSETDETGTAGGEDHRNSGRLTAARRAAPASQRTSEPSQHRKR